MTRIKPEKELIEKCNYTRIKEKELIERCHYTDFIAGNYWRADKLETEIITNVNVPL